MVGSPDLFTAIVSSVVLVFCVIASVAFYRLYHNPAESTSIWTRGVICTCFFLLLGEPTLSVLDVLDANRCRRVPSPVDPAYDFKGCTLPLHYMWLVVFALNMIMVFLVIPFTIFFNQVFANRCFGKRILFSMGAALLIAGLASLIYWLLHKVGGDMVYSTQLLVSGTDLMPTSGSPDSIFATDQCWPVNNTAYGGSVIDGCSWRSPDVLGNSDFMTDIPGPHHVVHFVLWVNTMLGGLFFGVWSGIGFVAHPWRMVASWAQRPRAVMTKTEFIRKCRQLTEAARVIRSRDALLRDKRKVQERALFPARDFLQMLRINRELAALEGEEEDMLLRFPQSEDPEATWSLQVIRLWMKLFVGLFSAVLSTLLLINLYYTVMYDSTLPLMENLFNIIPVAVDPNAYAISVLRVILMLIINQHVVCCTMTGQRVVQDVMPLASIHCLRTQKTLCASMISNLLGLVICLQAMLSYFVVGLDQAYDSTVISYLAGPAYGQGFTYQAMVNAHPILLLMIAFTMISLVTFPSCFLFRFYRSRYGRCARGKAAENPIEKPPTAA